MGNTVIKKLSLEYGHLFMGSTVSFKIEFKQSERFLIPAKNGSNFTFEIFSVTFLSFIFF